MAITNKETVILDILARLDDELEAALRANGIMPSRYLQLLTAATNEVAFIFEHERKHEEVSALNAAIDKSINEYLEKLGIVPSFLANRQHKPVTIETNFAKWQEWYDKKQPEPGAGMTDSNREWLIKNEPLWVSRHFPEWVANPDPDVFPDGRRGKNSVWVANAGKGLGAENTMKRSSHKGLFVGAPRATDMYSVEQLTSFGMVGIYRPKTNEEKRAEFKACDEEEARDIILARFDDGRNMIINAVLRARDEAHILEITRDGKTQGYYYAAEEFLMNGWRERVAEVLATGKPAHGY